MTDELTNAVEAYEESLQRAIFMCRLQELADSLMHGTDEDREIAHLLRCVWVAVHQRRTAQLADLVTDTVDVWIEAKVTA
jgi:hypothetical protein